MPHESTVAHEDSPEGLPEVSPFAYRARCDQSDEKPDAKRAKVYILVNDCVVVTSKTIQSKILVSNFA